MPSNKITFTTDNKKIVEFYTKNPHLNFDVMNCIFIDLIENIKKDITGNLNTTISSDILTTIKDLSKDLTSFKQLQSLTSLQFQTDFASLKDILSKLNTDITNGLVIKFNDIKHSYIDELKTVINTSEKTNIIKFIDIIEKHNDTLLSKTTNVINDVVPKNNSSYYKQLETIIISLKKDMNENIDVLKNNKNDLTTDKITQMMENKYNQFIIGVQQPILNYITSSEERLTTNINIIKDNNNDTKNNQEKINEQMNEFLKKYNNNASSNIGKLNEGKLFIVLNNLYPNHEIIDCSNKSKHGDIILRRQTYKDVIFENKHYTSNVPKEDVFKFIRDCEEQNSSGILLSNCSGISNKNNFQIDITTENNVLVYIHKAEYDEFKIQTAVNIIDHITTILNQIKKETNKNIITDDIMIDINQEFQTFLNQKETLINLIRETNKKIISQITDIELPSLQKLLSSKFASTKTLDLKCDICNKFTGSNLKSLSIHKRKCSTNNNNNNKEDTGSDTPVENNTIVEIKKNNKKK
jgi:hypothetical protein